MESKIRKIIRIVTVATSLIIAVVELKNAIEGFQKELKDRRKERGLEPKQRDNYAT